MATVDSKLPASDAPQEHGKAQNRRHTASRVERIQTSMSGTLRNWLKAGVVLGGAAAAWYAGNEIQNDRPGQELTSDVYRNAQRSRSWMEDGSSLESRRNAIASRIFGSFHLGGTVKSLIERFSPQEREEKIQITESLLSELEYRLEKDGLVAAIWEDYRDRLARGGHGDSTENSAIEMNHAMNDAIALHWTAERQAAFDEYITTSYPSADAGGEAPFDGAKPSPNGDLVIK